MLVRIRMKICWLFAILLCTSIMMAQSYISVYGFVRDQENNPVELASVVVDKFSMMTQSNEDGSYEIQIPTNQPTTIQFRRTGFKPAIYNIPGVEPGKRFQ